MVYFAARGYWGHKKQYHKILSAKTMSKIKKIITFPFLLFIRLYQKTISPDHGFLKRFYPNGYCKFYPSCSEYGYQAIKKYGVIKGGVKTLYRIVRCNPWNKGGIDQP